MASQQAVIVVEQQQEEQEMVEAEAEAEAAVVSMIDPSSQEVLQEVHFTMELDGTAQEQQVSLEISLVRFCLSDWFVYPILWLDQVVEEESQAEALAAAAAGDNLICQAIINSGLALGTEETVVEEVSQTVEDVDKVESEPPDADQSVIEIQVKEEFVETERVRVTDQHRNYM